MMKQGTLWLAVSAAAWSQQLAGSQPVMHPSLQNLGKGNLYMKMYHDAYMRTDSEGKALRYDMLNNKLANGHSLAFRLTDDDVTDTFAELFKPSNLNRLYIQHFNAETVKEAVEKRKPLSIASLNYKLTNPEDQGVVDILKERDIVIRHRELTRYILNSPAVADKKDRLTAEFLEQKLYAALKKSHKSHGKVPPLKFVLNQPSYYTRELDIQDTNDETVLLYVTAQDATRNKDQFLIELEKLTKEKKNPPFVLNKATDILVLWDRKLKAAGKPLTREAILNSCTDWERFCSDSEKSENHVRDRNPSQILPELGRIADFIQKSDRPQKTFLTFFQNYIPFGFASILNPYLRPFTLEAASEVLRDMKSGKFLTISSVAKFFPQLAEKYKLDRASYDQHIEDLFANKIEKAAISHLPQIAAESDDEEDLKSVPGMKRIFKSFGDNYSRLPSVVIENEVSSNPFATHKTESDDTFRGLRVIKNPTTDSPSVQTTSKSTVPSSPLSKSSSPLRTVADTILSASTTSVTTPLSSTSSTNVQTTNSPNETSFSRSTPFRVSMSDATKNIDSNGTPFVRSSGARASLNESKNNGGNESRFVRSTPFPSSDSSWTKATEKSKLSFQQAIETLEKSVEKNGGIYGTRMLSQPSTTAGKGNKGLSSKAQAAADRIKKLVEGGKGQNQDSPTPTTQKKVYKYQLKQIEEQKRLEKEREEKEKLSKEKPARAQRVSKLIQEEKENLETKPKVLTEEEKAQEKQREEERKKEEELRRIEQENLSLSEISADMFSCIPAYEKIMKCGLPVYAPATNVASEVYFLKDAMAYKFTRELREDGMQLSDHPVKRESTRGDFKLLMKEYSARNVQAMKENLETVADDILFNYTDDSNRMYNFLADVNTVSRTLEGVLQVPNDGMTSVEWTRYVQAHIPSIAQAMIEGALDAKLTKNINDGKAEDDIVLFHQLVVQRLCEKDISKMDFKTDKPLVSVADTDFKRNSSGTIKNMFKNIGTVDSNAFSVKLNTPAPGTPAFSLELSN